MQPERACEQSSVSVNSRILAQEGTPSVVVQEDDYSARLEYIRQLKGAWIAVEMTFNLYTEKEIEKDVLLLNPWVVARWAFLYPLVSECEMTGFIWQGAPAGEEHQSLEAVRAALKEANVEPLPVSINGLSRDLFAEYISYLVPYCHAECFLLGLPTQLVHGCCSLPQWEPCAILRNENLEDNETLNILCDMATYLVDNKFTLNMASHVAEKFNMDFEHQSDTFGHIVRKWQRVFHSQEMDYSLFLHIINLLPLEEQEALDRYMKSTLQRAASAD